MNLPNLPTLDAASRKRWSDAKRILVMLACGLITLRGSTPLAQLLGMPEIAWLGMLIGTGFASAIIHSVNTETVRLPLGQCIPPAPP